MSHDDTTQLRKTLCPKTFKRHFYDMSMFKKDSV